MGVGQILGKIFGGGAEPPKGEVLLRAYGKLPMYAEYRRLELAPGAATAFSQWLDAGRLAWVKSPTRTEGGVTRPTRLVLQPPESKEWIVASLWDSRDSLGRVFPFCFFVTCAAESLGRSPLEQWASATTLHRDFDRFYGELPSLGGGGDFYTRFRKRLLTLNPDDAAMRAAALCDHAARVPADAWLEGLPGFADEAAIGQWLAELMRRAHRWSSQSGAAAELALALPLAAGLPFGAQVVLWLEWLAPLLERVGRTPWIVAPGDSAKGVGAACVMLRPPLAEDFQLCTTDSQRYNYVEQLTPPLESAAGDDPTATPLAALQGSVLAWLRAHAVRV